MRLTAMVLSALLLAGCSNGCPFSAGDDVIRGDDGKRGYVAAVDGWGRRTQNCRIAVVHDDGSSTPEYTHHWHYRGAPAIRARDQ